MLYNSVEFAALQSGLDAMWMKQRVHSDNIANYSTPGYKAKSLKFEDVLSGTSQNVQHNFKATVTTDNKSTVRPDGSNVSMELEEAELWKAYAQYNYLSQKISGQFKNMRYVINQALK